MTSRRVDRIWRMEQRQTEIIARLNEIIGRMDRVQLRLDEATQRRESHDWRLDSSLADLTKHIDELARRPASGGGTCSVNMPLILKIVLGFASGLIWLIAMLALGKAFSWPV